MQTDRPTSLAGLRVLLVEDTALVAAELERVLRKAGCEVIATCATVGQGLDAVRAIPDVHAGPDARGTVDCALLDVNLRGERVYPVAEELAQRGIPFAFLTGYAGESLPAKFQSRPMLEKPFGAAELTAFVERLIEPSSRPG